MLQRGSDEFTRISEALGIGDVPHVTMPSKMLTLPSETIDGLKRVFSVNHTRHFINSTLAPYRTINARAVYLQDDYIPSRYFFITSVTIVTGDTLAAPGINNYALYGGECEQMNAHYHYIAVFEYPVIAADLVVPTFVKIERVHTSVWRCRDYIDKQIIHLTEDAEVWSDEYRRPWDLRRAGEVVKLVHTINIYKDSVWYGVFTGRPGAPFRPDQRYASSRPYSGQYNAVINCSLQNRAVVYASLNASDEFRSLRQVVLIRYGRR